MRIADAVANACVDVADNRTDSLSKLAMRVSNYDTWVDSLPRADFVRYFKDRVSPEVEDMAVNGWEVVSSIHTHYCELDEPSDLYTLCMLLACVLYDMCREVCILTSWNEDYWRNMCINGFVLEDLKPLLVRVNQWGKYPQLIDMQDRRLCQRLMFLLARIVEVEVHSASEG